MLRGEIPLTEDIPIQSGAEALPTPTGTYRIRILITTSSDWATLELKSGGTLVNPRLVSVSPEAINLGVNGNHFAIGQPIARANSGSNVELVVDVYLSGVQAGEPLQFVIESGSIGHTTVILFNYLQDAPVEANTMVFYETSQTFNVPADKIVAP